MDEVNSQLLVERDIDIVISTKLPNDIYYLLKGLQIIVVVLGDLEECMPYSDLVIDCKNEDIRCYFTGKEYSFIENPNCVDKVKEVLLLATHLEWDSEFFGFNIHYITSRHLTDVIHNKLKDVCRGKSVRLLEFLCNCHDSRSVRIAEKEKFEFVDIRLTYQQILNANIAKVQIPEGLTLGKAEIQHIDRLKELTKDLYQHSRYYYDVRFDQDKINEFYANWIKKAVLGTFDSYCYCLFDSQGKPLGFCSIRENSNQSVHIGLFGIDDEHHGKGFGKTLVNAVLHELYTSGIRKVLVVTQGRNYKAQVLYQKCGFVTTSTELWYHKWLNI